MNILRKLSPRKEVASPGSFPKLSLGDQATIGKHFVKAVASGEVELGCKGSFRDSMETKVRTPNHCCKEDGAIVCGGSKKRKKTRRTTRKRTTHKRHLRHRHHRRTGKRTGKRLRKHK